MTLGQFRDRKLSEESNSGQSLRWESEAHCKCGIDSKVDAMMGKRKERAEVWFSNRACLASTRSCVLSPVPTAYTRQD